MYVGKWRVSMNIPKHIAIILDGNGRWAKSKGMPRSYGHIQGAKNLDRIVEAAYDMGVKYLTVYCFSTENWNRPAEEVEALMKLLRQYMKTAQTRAKKNNIRTRVIGDISRLDEDLQKSILELEKVSAEYDGINLNIAINYGSRDEIVRGVRKMLKDNLNPEELDEAVFSSYLDTKDIPDPDFLIRTSGEQRLSNYLLWQLAYAEMYFTDVPWPEFSPEDLKVAVEFYATRDRRYGKV